MKDLPEELWRQELLHGWSRTPLWLITAFLGVQAGAH